jgi:signal transduction histidine kinase
MPSARPKQRLRWLGGAAVLVVAATFALAAARPPLWVQIDVPVGLACTGSAWALLAAHPGRDRIGLLLAGIAALTAASGVAYLLGLVSLGPAGRLGEPLYLAAVGVCAPAAVALFPTGRTPGPAVTLCAAVAVAAGAVSAATQPHPAVADPAAAFAGGVLLVGGCLRFARAAGGERRALLWLAWGCGAAAVMIFHVGLAAAAVFRSHAAATAALAVGLAIPPACVALARVGSDWLDIRWIIRCTAVWTASLEVAVAVAGGLLAALELGTRHSPGRGAATVVCVLVAVGFQPLRRRAESVLDDVLFGGQADPLVALSGLGERLDSGGKPTEWLPVLRTSLALPYLELRHQDESIAVAGTRGAVTVTVPLVARDERVGDLVVGLPPPVAVLPPATATVLRLVAPPLAQALRAAHLAEQLQISRGQLVGALEDERRRLRRDLHDGLGPVLAGIAYSADAARNLIPPEGPEPGPERARALLAELRADAAGAISEVRRIAYGLRPPALDELGLVAAIRQRAGRLSAPDGRPVTVRIDVADDLPALPAAVEVAAYRIAVEAIANAARHSGSTDVALSVQAGASRLRIAVRDGGAAGAVWTPGVGLQSMRERAEQLGGTVTVTPAGGGGGAGGGGLVQADLPLGPGPPGRPDAGWSATTPTATLPVSAGGPPE